MQIDNYNTGSISLVSKLLLFIVILLIFFSANDSVAEKPEVIIENVDDEFGLLDFVATVIPGISVKNAEKMEFKNISYSSSALKTNEIFFSIFTINKINSNYEQMKFSLYQSNSKIITDEDIKPDNHFIVNRSEFSDSSYTIKSPIERYAPNSIGTYYFGVCATGINSSGISDANSRVCSEPHELIVKDGSQTIVISTVTSSELNTSYICRPGDTLNFIGENFDKYSSNYDIYYVSEKDQEKPLSYVINNSSLVSVTCPITERQYGKIVLDFGGDEPYEFDIQFSLIEDPIVEEAIYNDGVLSLSGVSLNKNFALHVDSIEIPLDNSQKQEGAILNVNIPNHIKSGYAHLVSDDLSSNYFFIDVATTRSGRLFIDSEIIDSVVVSSGSEKVSDINTDGTFNIGISRYGSDELVQAYIDSNASPISIYSAVVFDEDSDVVLDAKNTAVALVWMRLNASVGLNKNSWIEFRNSLFNSSSVDALSDYIERQVNDKNYQYKSNSVFINLLISALNDITDSLNSTLDGIGSKSNSQFFPKHKSSILSKDSTLRNSFTVPGYHDQIYVKDADDEIVIGNMTRLYLSTEILGENGLKLKRHVNDSLLKGAINPHTLGLQKTFTNILFGDFNFPEEKFNNIKRNTSQVNILTPGFDNGLIEDNPDHQAVVDTLRAKLVSDILIVPVFSKVIGIKDRTVFEKFAKRQITILQHALVHFLSGDFDESINFVWLAIQKDISSKTGGVLADAMTQYTGLGGLSAILQEKLLKEINEKFFDAYGIDLNISDVGRWPYKLFKILISTAAHSKFLIDLGEVDTEINFTIDHKASLEFDRVDNLDYFYFKIDITDLNISTSDELIISLIPSVDQYDDNAFFSESEIVERSENIITIKIHGQSLDLLESFEGFENPLDFGKKTYTGLTACMRKKTDSGYYIGDVSIPFIGSCIYAENSKFLLHSSLTLQQIPDQNDPQETITVIAEGELYDNVQLSFQIISLDGFFAPEHSILHLKKGATANSFSFKIPDALIETGQKYFNIVARSANKNGISRVSNNIQFHLKQ